MYFYEGIEIQSLDQLETLIVNLDEANKIYIRNEYNGIPNIPTLTEAQQADLLEVKRIYKRRQDGIERIVAVKAKLRNQRLASGVPDNIYTQYIYVPMSGVISKIESGDWLDAYNMIDSVPTNTVLTSQHIIGWKRDIANYIVGDGDYLEYKGKSVDETTGSILP
jgi:hypothetical protein